MSTIAISDIGEAAVIQAGAVAALVAFLSEGGDEGKANAAGALWNISDSDEGKAAALDAGAVGPLIDLFAETDEKCKTNAAHALWNIASSVAGKEALLSKDGLMQALVGIFEGSVSISKVAVGMCLWHVAMCTQGKTIMQKSALLLKSLENLQMEEIYFEYNEGPGCSWKAQDHSAEWIFFQVSATDGAILRGGVFKMLLKVLNEVVPSVSNHRPEKQKREESNVQEESS